MRLFRLGQFSGQFLLLLLHVFQGLLGLIAPGIGVPQRLRKSLHIGGIAPGAVKGFLQKLKLGIELIAFGIVAVVKHFNIGNNVLPVEAVECGAKGLCFCHKGTSSRSETTDKLGMRTYTGVL